MSLLRPALVLPICASLVFHVAMGWSVAKHWSASSSSEEAIQISYVETHKTPKPSASPSIPAAPSGPKKKVVRGIPIPRLPVNEAAPESPPSDFEKVVKKKIDQQQRLLEKLNAAPAKNSAEIMADPKKGKIFVGYFTEVRRKIQDTLSSRYAHKYSVRGGVALGFVLNSQGFVEKVAVLEKGTDGDARLQELAIQCLREAAPFGAFPPELGSDRIAFNVTIFFDGR